MPALRTLPGVLALLFCTFSNSWSQSLNQAVLEKYQLSLPLQTTIQSNAISHAAINSNTGDVWFATSKGLRATNNGGASFRGHSGAEALIRQGTYGLYVQNDTLLASTAYRSDKSGNPPAGDGFFISTNNALSWQTLTQPLDSPNDTTLSYGSNTLKALPIIVPEQNVIYDFAIGPTPSMIWAATWSGGIRRSTDFGQTWQRVVLPPTGRQTISPGENLDFVVEPQRGSTGHFVYLGFSVCLATDGSLWVGTVDGLCKSTNPGEVDPSWVKYNRAFSQITGNWVTVIKEQPETKAIWAATWQAEGIDEYDGLSYTTDNGQTWQTTLAGERIYDLGFEDHTIYAAGVNGLFISRDGGSSWIQKFQLTDKSDPKRQILAGNEFYCTQTELLSGNAARIWVGSENGLAFSEDEGMSWTILRADRAVSSKSKTYAYPNPFSPKLDQVVRLRYRLNTAGSVKITIYDFNMSPVRKLLKGDIRTQTPEDEESWDGKNDFGGRVTNGVYFYRVETPNQAPIWGKILVLQ
jgi:hypothetical protein